MRTNIKKKKPEIAEDDVIRRFVTHHVEDVAKEGDTKLKPKERAEIVDMIMSYHGDSLTAIVRNTAEMILGDTDDEDEEEDS